MLRMVMDGKDTQAQQWRGYLEAECRKGRLVYGMHKSPDAPLACIIQSDNDNYLHLSMAAMADMRWRCGN